MLKVKMIAPTYWEGKRLKAGDVTSVADKVGERWIGAGIAKSAGEQNAGGNGGEKSLEKMTTAELTQKAAELGVDISGATNNKQRIEAIQAFVIGGSGAGGSGAGGSGVGADGQGTGADDQGAGGSDDDDLDEE